MLIEHFIVATGFEPKSYAQESKASAYPKHFTIKTCGMFLHISKNNN